MPPEMLQIAAQLGIGAVLFYLLMEERKARQTLETRMSEWVDEWMDIAKDSSRPRRPQEKNSNA